MTNKLEIDRELVKNCADYMEGSASMQVQLWHDKLRAILAQPYHVVCSNGILCQDSSCAECGGNGSIDISSAAPVVERQEPVLPTNGALISDLTSTIAQQAQRIADLERGRGEPVAWLNVYTGHITTSAVAVMDWDDEKEQVQSLYASPPAPVSVVLPEGYMIVERSIWTEEQAESAAKCITMLKNVPGMTDRDLALAAMDAGQCHAPEITLADFACLDKVKELNQ